MMRWLGGEDEEGEKGKEKKDECSASEVADECGWSEMDGAKCEWTRNISRWW